MDGLGGGRPVVRENVGEIRVLKRRRAATVRQVRGVRGRRQSSGKRRAPRVSESCENDKNRSVMDSVGNYPDSTVLKSCLDNKCVFFVLSVLILTLFELYLDLYIVLVI